MDYTLAVYNAPLYEEITYDLTIAELLKRGYPEDIKTLKYDPSFPIRLARKKSIHNQIKSINH